MYYFPGKKLGINLHASGFIDGKIFQRPLMSNIFLNGQDLKDNLWDFISHGRSFSMLGPLIPLSMKKRISMKNEKFKK